MSEAYSYFGHLASACYLSRKHLAWFGVPVRVPGRKRWGVRVAPLAEWVALENGATDIHPDGLNVVGVGLSRTLRKAVERAPSKFGLLLPDEASWSHIGRKFRWALLGRLEDSAQEIVVRHVRTVLAREYETRYRGSRGNTLGGTA